MKTIRIPFILSLVFWMNSYALSIKEQLKSVNRYWIYHPIEDKIMNEEHLFSSDRELIQFHLQQVENTLRARYTGDLSEGQKKNRLRMLDVLHDYWVKGSFPKNTAHPVRTPYFIDMYRTACAVGHLIISSGRPTFARKISQENNNGYMSELVVKYPEIIAWANEYGFTTDELAWIQPCYGAPLDTVGLRQPTCHNSANGYFCPDLSQLQGPLTGSFYRWQNSTWMEYKDVFCGHWLFYACSAGKYKWAVKDNQSTIHTFTTELTAPPPATVTIAKSGDFKNCNGTISVSVQGGILPFTYFWPGFLQNSGPVLNSICEESVALTFYEAGNLCPQFIQAQGSPVGLAEEKADIMRFFPNPVNDIIQLKFGIAPQKENRIVKIINIQGQVVLETYLKADRPEINLSQLPSGLYLLYMDGYKPLRLLKE